ncbi:MAG: ribosomal protein [Pseudomonadota bacterium]|jgi:large subunit ribosomal protein L25
MKFVAFERSKQGTGASRRLRNSGRTPGIVYGGMGKEPLAIEMDHNFLWHAIKKEAFHASVLEMEIDGQVTPVLLRDLQMHPYKQMVLHIDFQRVDANTRMHKKVPLHFTGQDESPAFKLDHCLITHVLSEMDISCLPADLPEFISVDLSALKKGTSLHLVDIPLPARVKAVVKGRENPVVVSVVVPAAEVSAAAAEAAPAAAAKGKGKGKK